MGFLGIFGGNKKRIVITPNDEYCVWELKLDANFAASVAIGTDCSVVHYRDGIIQTNKYGSSILNSGDEIEINTKKYKEKVVAANVSKIYTINWGVGGVEYCDEDGRSTNIGMHGVIKFNISNPERLCGAAGKHNIKVADIKTMVESELKNVTSGALVRRINGMEFGVLQAQPEMIGRELFIESGNFGEALTNFGITMSSISVDSIFFPEEYLNQRRSGNTTERGDKGDDLRALFGSTPEKEKSEADKLKEILEGVKGFNVNPEPTTKICPKCKKQCDANAKFCDKCGYKF